MTRVVFWTACLMLALTSPAAAQGGARDPIGVAIEAANKQFVDSFAKGDAAQLAAMYTSTALAFPPNSDPVKGRAALQKLWQGAIDSGVKAITLTSTEVEGHGNTAIEVGTYEMKGDGGKVLDRGKYIVVWKREQGQWRLHRDIWNTNMPAAK